MPAVLVSKETLQCTLAVFTVSVVVPKASGTTVEDELSTIEGALHPTNKIG
jgi:hypothetical protein